MNETEKKNAPRKGVVVALGISCIVLVACLGAAFTAYTLAINDKNDEISSLNSQVSQLNSDFNSAFELLFSNFSSLQNQSAPVLNTTGATFVSINEINFDPAKWENKTVIVVGKLSGLFAYPTAISYYYVLSSNETSNSLTGLDVNSIGVDIRNRSAIYNGSTALVTGVVKKGIIGTMVQGAQPTTVYYIEEQAILIS
jgi:hypothetical protein